MSRIDAAFTVVGKQAAALLDRVAPTARERALLALLAAALAIVAAVEAGTYALDARAAAGEQRMAAAAAERAVARVRDPARRTALKTAAEEVRAWSFDDPTPDIALVRAQTDLDSLARSAGLNDVRVIVAPGAHASPTGPLRLTIEAEFSWGGLDLLLSALAKSSQSYAIEALEVDEDQASLRIDVRAPYLGPGAAS